MKLKTLLITTLTLLTTTYAKPKYDLVSVADIGKELNNQSHNVTAFIDSITTKKPSEGLIIYNENNNSKVQEIDAVFVTNGKKYDVYIKNFNEQNKFREKDEITIKVRPLGYHPNGISYITDDKHLLTTIKDRGIDGNCDYALGCVDDNSKLQYLFQNEFEDRIKYASYFQQIYDDALKDLTNLFK